MDIDEIKQKKKILENNLHVLIHNFKKETGANIKEIDIRFIPAIEGFQRIHLYDGVSVIIEL